MMTSEQAVAGFEPVVFTRLMKIEDVARVTQFKVSTIRSFILKGKIPYLKMGNCVRFYPARIMAWIEETAKEK
jgi:excisionase family DNA binding protein